MVTTKPKLKGPPPDMEVPQEIVLKRSGVDPERIGIWCKSHIPCGKKFGPFMGNKVQEATDDMDPTYVWEIVDLNTKEFLFYIDATNEKEGNWMRYINCARFFEEQNIVSEQEGVDIIYRAIKDIYPEQELLTWYEKAPLRKRKGRRIKRAPKAEVTEPFPSSSGSPSASKNDLESDCPIPIMMSTSSGNGDQSGASMDVDCPRRADGDSSELHVSQRGRRCKVTKYWEMEADFSEEESDLEMTVKSQDNRKSENGGNLVNKSASAGDEEWSASGADPDNHHKTLPHLSSEILGELAKDPRDYYQFEMKPCHIVRNRVGRKLFQCDICSSVYRHSFSLKRHYVRNHLNYKYVSPTDLINCCVPLKSIPPDIQAELRRSVKHEASSDSLSIGTHKDIQLDDLASEDNDQEKAMHDVHDGHSALTSSPSMGSLASVNRDDVVEEHGKSVSEEMSVHSDECVAKESENGVHNTEHDIGEADKMDCYDGDTEIEEDFSDNDGENGAGGVGTEMRKRSILNSVLQEKEVKSPGSRIPITLCSDQCANGKDVSLSGCSMDGGDMNCQNGTECQHTTERNGCNSVQMKCADAESEHGVASVDMVNENKVICDDICGSGDNSGQQTVSPILDKCSSQPSDCEEPKSALCDKSAKMSQGSKCRDPGHDGQNAVVADAGSKIACPDLPQNGKGEPMFGLFRCNVCEKVFDTIGDLKQHLANHPDATDGRQTFACEKCEMKFAHKQNLMRHQAVHTGARPYICNYCDKKFPTSTNLRRHEKLHQVRKFSCHHCHSVFTQTGDLKKHIHSTHPELFHECGFCTRYFVKKRLLVDHLRETHHGKTMDDNSVEIEAKQDAFQYDLHLDRAESMRLAITPGRNKPGPRFACTVCRKKFHDYTSMCRHRRLAHQRPIFVAPITDENGDVIDDAVQHYINPNKHGFYDPEDEEQAVFYASIANVIADNLQNCIEGKEEQLREVTPLVKWKNKNNANAVSSKSESDAKSAKVIAESVVYNLQEFNFPKDFKLKSSTNCYRAVPYSSDGRISWKNKKVLSERKRTESTGEQGQAKVNSLPRKDGSGGCQTSQSSALLQFLQNDITSMPQTMTSTSILARAELSSPKCSDGLLSPPLKKPKVEVPDLQVDQEKCPRLLPIRVPQVKSCRICRCLFHNHSLFQQHMFNKHGILIEHEKTDVVDNGASSGSNDQTMPKPAHSHSGSPGNKNGSVTPVTCTVPSFCQPVKIKTELPWDEPPVLTEIRNDDLGGVEQAAGSTTGPPDNLDLIDDLQPLDLSKKSHLAGYKLTNRGGAESGDRCRDENDATPPLVPQGEADAKSEAKPRQAGAKFICQACYGRYDTYNELIVHQEDDHPNVTCSYTQLDEEVATSLLSTPNPIGILNVCSTQLPPVTASPKRTNKLSCTKCSKTFQCMADLHNHIADCAEPYIPKMMFVYYYPGAKNRHFFLPGAKGEMVKVKKGQKFRRNASDTKKANNASASNSQGTTQDGGISEDSQNNLKKQNGLDELYLNQMLNGKKKRRRNYELLYNPHRHIRRREMAEIIDTPKCFGCNGLFSTISLLERHIPMCRHKDKIQDQGSTKEGEQAADVEEDEDDEDAYDPNKHMCIYCQKQFTYFGMLRKHVFDVCPIRADLVERGEYIDEEWERDINTRAGQPGGVQSRTLSRQSSMSSLNGGDLAENGDNSAGTKPAHASTRGRRRRRGNGWYRGKDKKKDNTKGEWEKYFVLDETFMGIYSSVAKTDDDDDDDGDDDNDDDNNRDFRNNDKDADKSSFTDTFDYNGDGSVQSTSSLGLPKVKDKQPSSSQYKQPKDYFEEMQQKKQALFAELTKPIDGSEASGKDSSTLLGLKQKDVSLSANVKNQREKFDKDSIIEEKDNRISPVKKDMTQKAKTKLSSADSLANVKQKLAKKIRENKKLHSNNSSVRGDARSSYKSLKLDKSPAKSPKKSPRKNVVETKSPNQKAKVKSPLKLSVSGQKPLEICRSDHVKRIECKVEHKNEEITGIQKVKKLKPKLRKVEEQDTSSVMIGEEFVSLGDIVNRYTKDRSKNPKLFLAHPLKRHVDVENENCDGHTTVDDVINAVVEGQSISGASSNAPIELTDSSDEDEDNMKLSELAKVDHSIRNGSLVQHNSLLAQSPRKTSVRNSSSVLVINNKTKASATGLKGIKMEFDNDVKHKPAKYVHKRKSGSGNGADEKASRTSDSSHSRSSSVSSITLNEVNKKLKECSRKRPRSSELATVAGGKKTKLEISKEAVKLTDAKSVSKKVKS